MCAGRASGRSDSRRAGEALKQRAGPRARHRGSPPPASRAAPSPALKLCVIDPGGLAPVTRGVRPLAHERVKHGLSASSHRQLLSPEETFAPPTMGMVASRGVAATSARSLASWISGVVVPLALWVPTRAHELTKHAFAMRSHKQQAVGCANESTGMVLAIMLEADSPAVHLRTSRRMPALRTPRSSRRASPIPIVQPNDRSTASDGGMAHDLLSL